MSLKRPQKRSSIFESNPRPSLSDSVNQSEAHTQHFHASVFKKRGERGNQTPLADDDDDDDDDDDGLYVYVYISSRH